MKPQQDLIDFSLSKTISIARPSAQIHLVDRIFETSNEFDRRLIVTFIKTNADISSSSSEGERYVLKRTRRLIVVYIYSSNSEGAHECNIELIKLKKWRRSSNSNDDATCVIFNEDVSHRVDVASEHGDDYDNNNPLQRLILPLILTPEAEMQMAVNVFELARACIFCIIIRNKPQQLIGEQFIASNNSVVGFQLVVESILILNSEGARAPSTTFPTLYNRKIELIVASHFSKTFLHFGKGFAIFCEGDRENANNGINSVKRASKLIVIYSKIPLHFSDEYRIFCEGELRQHVDANDDGIVAQQLTRIFDKDSNAAISQQLVGLGQTSLVGLGLISLVGHIGLIGIVGLVDLGGIRFISPVGISDFDFGFGLISLVGISGFGYVLGIISHVNGFSLDGLKYVDHISLVGRKDFIGQIGLVDQVGPDGIIGLVGFGLNGLDGFDSINGLFGFGLVELIGLIGLSNLGMISLVGLLASSARRLIGFIGKTGFIGLGLVGFIGLGIGSLVIGISLDLISHVGLISHISLISLGGFSGIDGCSLIELIGHISLVSFICVSGWQARVRKKYSDNNDMLQDCFAAAIPAAAARTNGVAMASSATKITNAAIWYYCAAYYWFVREGLLWHVPRLDSNPSYTTVTRYNMQNNYFISAFCK